MSRNRIFAPALLTAIALAAVGAASALAGGGNSTNAKLCQKNGWQVVQSDNGGTFTSNDDCTAQAAEGAGVFAPALVATQNGCFTINDNGPFALEHFDASGFHSNSDISFYPPGSQYPFPVQVTTDANGSASLPGYVLENPGAGSLTAIDAQGVHATVNFTTSC